MQAVRTDALPAPMPHAGIFYTGPAEEMPREFVVRCVPWPSPPQRVTTCSCSGCTGRIGLPPRWGQR